jgi:hypothetical protein
MASRVRVQTSSDFLKTSPRKAPAPQGTGQSIEIRFLASREQCGIGSSEWNSPGLTQARPLQCPIFLKKAFFMSSSESYPSHLIRLMPADTPEFGPPPCLLKLTVGGKGGNPLRR